MEQLTSNRRWCHLVAAGAFVLMLATPLAAQSLAPGSRVRVRTTAFPGEWLTGTLTEQTSGAIWVDDRKLLTESVIRLEMANGKRSRFGKGLTIGALTGAGMGVIVALSTDNSQSSLGDKGVVAAVLVPGLAAVGAATGGIIGALSKTDRWLPVATDRIRVTMAPSLRGGLAMGVRASF